MKDAVVDGFLRVQVQHQILAIWPSRHMAAAAKPAAAMAKIKNVSAALQIGERDGMKGLRMSIPALRFGVAAWSADAHSSRQVEGLSADRRRDIGAATANVALYRELQQ